MGFKKIILILFLLCCLTGGANAIEWVFGNPVNIESGGANAVLTSTTAKTAIEYIPAENKTATNISVLLSINTPDPDGTTNWRIGIQEDNSGVPTGTYLGSNIFNTYSDESWKTIELNESVSVTKGTKYWIVLQYDSGSVPTASYNWLNFYASNPPSVNVYSGDCPLAYNDSGDILKASDISKTTVLEYRTTSWATSTRPISCFMIGFSDGSTRGQIYKHQYFFFYRSLTDGKLWESGERFNVSGGNRTVNTLSVPIHVGHDDMNATGYWWSNLPTEEKANNSTRPSDNLYYYIKQGNQTGTVLRSGILVRPDEAEVATNSNGAGSRKWYNVTFDNLTFVEGQAYFIGLYSNTTTPNGNFNCSWGADFPYSNSEYESNTTYIKPNLNALTYGGTENYFIQSTNNWSTSTSYQTRDMSFLFGYESEDEPTVTPPTAEFTANVTTGTYPLRVSFTDNSTDSPTSWYWDFDNNGVIDSTLQNSTCKYKTPGNYTVNLTVFNSGGSDTETKINYITVQKTNVIILIYNWFSNILPFEGVWLS